ncbi:MAG: trimethylamine methyltransferase family protein, partial [Deltaproteobacteria bacterium]|nr:trimethylamine methyltransferase family protein [Deltaproteobacteria bacterium]
MIQSSKTEHTSIQFKILSDHQIWEIRQASFEILEKTGVKLTHPEAVSLVKAAGAFVEGERVRLPRHIVEKALFTAPKGITIYDRDGVRALEVEGRKTYFGCSTGSPNTLDPLTGEVRGTRVEDIEQAAKICDALENIDWVMPMGSAMDIDPDKARDIFDFEAIVNNTTKPMVLLSYSQRALEAVYDMAAVVAGGMEKLRQRPFILSYPEPISPLVFPDEVIAKVLFVAGLGMPQIPGPTCQIGATSPVTIAGAVAQNIAEGLFTLVLTQLKTPGAPCFLSGNVAGFDMATGGITVGAPESSLGISVQAEVAQSFGLPTWGLAGATDAKLLDAQAGAESAFSILSQALAGLNMIHDVGYLDGSMICSPDMLVMGNELIGMAKRFIRGV